MQKTDFRTKPFLFSCLKMCVLYVLVQSLSVDLFHISVNISRPPTLSDANKPKKNSEWLIYQVWSSISYTF